MKKFKAFICHKSLKKSSHENLPKLKFQLQKAEPISKPAQSMIQKTQQIPSHKKYQAKN